MSIRILLADDHAILREGLRSILNGAAGLEVVGEAENGRDAVALADQLSPDLVVMDIGMKGLNGVEATRQMLLRDPKLKVIALSAYTEKQFVLAMLEAGAVGYVIKAAASDELLEAIRAAVRNHKYLSPGVLDGAATDGLWNPALFGKSAYNTLSARQREVLQLLAEGKPSRDIAKALKIAENTVEVHRHNIMHRLGCKSIAELTKYAVREGLTPL